MGVCLDEEQTSIVSQFYSQGSCYKVFLRDQRPVPWKDLLKVVKGAAAGILHLHAENYIHRDIASRNILISDSFEGIVTDFGMSRLQLRDGSQSITYLGPVKWMAPESIRDRIISKATDVYMFGSFMWELIVRDIPYADEDPFAAALKVINQGCSLAMPEDCHPGYLSLMEACLKTVPEERPTFVEIFERLEELFEEAETNPSLTYAKPSTTGLIVAQRNAPKSVYVDSSPIFELGTLQLESSPSPFKPESKISSPSSRSGSSKGTTVGYMDSMTSTVGYMDAMPRSNSPLGVPATRTSLGVPARRKSTPVNQDGYLEVMPTIAINANGYIFTRSDLTNSGASSSRDTGSSSPTSPSSPNTSDPLNKSDPAPVKSSATSAPRSIPSPGRPKSMAPGSVSPSNGSTPIMSKFQYGSLDSAVSGPHSTSLPCVASPRGSTTTTTTATTTTNTTASTSSGRANSLKISTSSSPSPSSTNTPPLSPTTVPGQRRMSASSSTGVGPGPRSSSYGSPSTNIIATSHPRTKDSNGSSSMSPSSSSPNVHSSQTSPNIRFGNTSDTPLRSNITLYSTRVVPSSELMGWQPQFHMEHTFKRSRMSSSAPSRASPVHMMGPGGNGNNNGPGNGGYPPDSNNKGPHHPSPYNAALQGHGGLSHSMGAPGTSPYTMRGPPPQQPSMQPSPHHGVPYQPSNGPSPQNRGPSLNNSAATGGVSYHSPQLGYPPSTAPSPHVQPHSGYKPSAHANNQPQNPFVVGGMPYPPGHGMVHGVGAPNYGGVPSHQPSHNAISPSNPPMSYPMQPQGNTKPTLQQSVKSKSPTSPQSSSGSIPSPNAQPTKAPGQLSKSQPPSNKLQPQANVSPQGGYSPQPVQNYSAPSYPTYAPAPANYPSQYFTPGYHAAPQSSHPPASVTSSTYTKPLPNLPPSSVTSSTYTKPLPAIPESSSRKSYAPPSY